MPSFRGRLYFCSNFYPAPLIYEGHEFATSEHAYAWAKVLEPQDRLTIQLASTPGQAKRLARRMVMRPDWDAVKLDVMRGILRAKFQAPALKALLLQTGDEELVEENEWGDTFWGTCQGRGENWLGRLLMDLRQELWGDGEEDE